MPTLSRAIPNVFWMEGSFFSFSIREFPEMMVILCPFNHGTNYPKILKERM
jgi:hypothetical protein